MFFNKKEKKEMFPYTLKYHQVVEQKENFFKIKEIFSELVNKEEILNTAIERQIYDNFFYSKVLVNKAGTYEPNKKDIEIFELAQSYIYAFYNARNKSDEQLDNLFNLYVETAKYLEENFKKTSEDLGYKYAVRGIYKNFKDFVLEIEKSNNG